MPDSQSLSFSVFEALPSLDHATRLELSKILSKLTQAAKSEGRRGAFREVAYQAALSRTDAERRHRAAREAKQPLTESYSEGQMGAINRLMSFVEAGLSNA